MKKISFIVLVLAVTAQTVFAQPSRRAMGEKDDPVAVEKTPKKIQLSERSYRGMPSANSLEQWCPTPGNQGDYGTCAAWATGYGVATLLYAKTHNLTNQSEIDKFAFSPSFLYQMVKSEDDKDCQGGASTANALFTLVETGDLYLSEMPYQCNPEVTLSHQLSAIDYRLGDVSLIFAGKGFTKEDKYYFDDATVIDLVKKSINEGSPVAISYMLPESFFKIQTPVWNPDPTEGMKDWKHNSHAMAIIGYDDNVAGGAVRVLNSWGSNWADKGKVWIKYTDFPKYVKLGLQVYGNPDSKPPYQKVEPQPEPKKEDPKPEPKQEDPKPEPKKDEPKPEPKKDDPKPPPPPPPSAPVSELSISGSMEFRLNTGQEMTVGKTSTRNLQVEDEQTSHEDLVAYTMSETYTSGTKFRFYLNTDKEVYIYALATDLTGKINKILPYDDNISTHVGSNSTIAFPSDTKIIKLDNNKGTDYLLILYSTQKLDLNAIISNMNDMSGSLSGKIVAALGDKLVPMQSIRYEKDKVAFSVGKQQSTRNLSVENESEEPTTGAVVPVMIEIKHN